MPRGWSLVVLIGVVVLLFAAPKLPQLARSLGQALRIFKAEVHEMKKEPSTTNSSSQVMPPLQEPHGKVQDIIKPQNVKDSIVTPDISD